MLLTLSVRFRPLLILAGLFFVREVFMLAGGLALVKSGRKIVGSKWFGKVSTGVLYVSLLLFILWPGLKADDPIAIALMVLMIAVVAFAFIMYIPIYFKIRNDREI